MSLLYEGDHVWSGFQAKETTSKQAVHIDQETAQTLLRPRPSIWLGEKMASVAFLSKDALGLLFVPRGELIFQECSS